MCVLLQLQIWHSHRQLRKETISVRKTEPSKIYYSKKLYMPPCIVWLILGIEDHFEVTEYLDELQTPQIIKLGEALGLYYPSLKKMQSPLEDMVEAWLRKDDSVLAKTGLPCWKSLMEALLKTKNTGIAEKIRQEKNV